MHPVESTPPDTVFCSECGRLCAADEVVRFGETRACSICKEIFTQRLREGALTLTKDGYGGFWIRGLALMIDGIILSAVVIPIQVTVVMGGALGQDPTKITIATLVMYLVGMLLGVSYEVFFLVRYAATPGKMACRLKVLTAEGHTLTWSRAVGRYFAKYISSMTLGIGFLVACVDEQKRALHDHICSTRVVKRAS